MAPKDPNNRTLKLLVVVGGVYSMYLLYGILQEQLYRTQEDGTTFSATAFVLLVQCLVNASIAAVGTVVSSRFGLEKREPYVEKRKGGERKVYDLLPFSSVLRTRAVALVATCYIFAMFTSNEALKYVPYPAQALAKSSKMVPVMLGSMILGKRYSVVKYAAVFLVTAGVYLFSTGKAAGSKHAKPGMGGGESGSGEGFGYVLLLGSLLLDGLSGPGQEQLDVFGLTTSQQMLASNLWASAIMLVVSLVAGQLDTSLAYLRAHPGMWTTLLLFGLTSAFGQLFVFYCIRVFDALTLSTITTTRKFFTIVLSVVLYGHNLSTQQWVSVALVFLGITIDTRYGKHGHAAHHPAPGSIPVHADGEPAAPAASTKSSSSGSGGTSTPKLHK